MSAKKFVAKFAVGVAFALSTGAASAALWPFCVNDTLLGGVGSPINGTACVGQGSQSSATGFAVDLFQGSYVERVNVTSLTGPSSGTFSATIVFNINSYSYLGTSQITALDNLPPGGYNLYGVVTATGSFSGQSFTSSSATLNVYGDANQDANMGFGGIDATTLAFTGMGAGDVLLASSTSLLSGTGSTEPAGGADGFAILFDAFTLTASGETFFIAPRPFYVKVYSDGDITDPSFDPTTIASYQFQGEASANFVPEPGSLALVGLALVAFGAARRRRA